MRGKKEIGIILWFEELIGFEEKKIYREEERDKGRKVKREKYI